MRSNSYVDFENEFRGDTESILSQFSKYDALINLIIKDIDDPILIDIGSEKTCLGLFKNLALVHSITFPIGADHITKDISQVCSLDLICLNWTNY